MNWKGPSEPSRALLETAAPGMVWEAVRKQAMRSPMVRYKTGCVLWDPSREEIIAKGCSHPDIKFSKLLASIHAERHAISMGRGQNIMGAWAILLTYNGRGGCTWTSRPCYSCACTLLNADVERVIFPERTRSGGWTVVTEYPDALIARAPIPDGPFSRQQRIPALA